jgi:hypothetical protein
METLQTFDRLNINFQHVNKKNKELNAIHLINQSLQIMPCLAINHQYGLNP